MTTLATMRTRIGSELRRGTSINTQINAAIASAIQAMEHDQYTFTQTRALTFNTVANQEGYSSGDIPRITKFDYVLSLQNTPNPFRLHAMDPATLDRLNAAGTLTGTVTHYCYYGREIRLHPAPATVFAVRVGCTRTIGAPATDDEANNPWMIEGERAVRCRSKYELFEHVLHNREMADKFNPDNDAGPTAEAMRQLRTRANRLTRIGEAYNVVPTQF